MARKRKPLTGADVETHKRYLTDRIEDGTYEYLLVEGADMRESIDILAIAKTPEQLEAWEDDHLSVEGRKKLVGAVGQKVYYEDLKRIALDASVVTSLDRLIDQHSDPDSGDSKTELRSQFIGRALKHMEIAGN